MDDINIGRGETLTIRLTVTDPLLKLWEIRSQVRKDKNSLDTGLAADLTSNWEESADGLFLVLTARDTKKWVEGRYETDVLFTSPSGTVKRSATQIINVKHGVTR